MPRQNTSDGYPSAACYAFPEGNPTYDRAWRPSRDRFRSQAGRFFLSLFVIARTSAALRCAVLLAGFSAVGRKTGR